MAAERAHEGEPKLRPHVRNPGGGYTLLDEIALDGVDLYQRHRLTIAVSGSTITASLDGTQVDTRTDTAHAGPGVVGIRTNGEEAGVVHRLTVTSADGAELVGTDFPAGDDTFNGGAVLPSGGLQVGGNADVWLRGDPLPVLRQDMSFPSAKIVKARIYAAAQGVYELRLNGKPVGDQELAPGWTDYRQRIAYQRMTSPGSCGPARTPWAPSWLPAGSPATSRCSATTSTATPPR